MKKDSAYTKKKTTLKRSYKILPAVFLLVSVLLMMLPLEGPVASMKALLSYIFIPQIRAAHGVAEYSKEVSDAVKGLLNTHQENEMLKAQLSKIQLENAQAREIFEENKRLTDALRLKAPNKWKGIWAKTAYREPSQWNSVVVDKGAADGVQLRAAAVMEQNGQPILAGIVIEVDENTAKVLLLRDEDFSAVVYTSESKEEGLLVGAGASDLKLKYLPLLSTVQEGESVYTSSSSSVFPAGILVGKITEVARSNDLQSYLTAYVKPASNSGTVQELFLLTKE